MKVTEEDAIRWVTANPAWALGVDSQTGTLEVGKDMTSSSGTGLLSASTPPPKKSGSTASSSTIASPSPPWSDFELGQEAGQPTDLLPTPGAPR
ncbi:MAG: amidohydrolase family protein [Polyangiaceae bacterium]